MIHFHTGNVVGFKKSEILKMIKEFDSSFSFDKDEALKHQNSTIENQANRIAELNTQLANVGDTIDRQAKEIAELKAQLEQQANQPSDTPADDSEIKNYTTPAMQAMRAVINEFWLPHTSEKVAPSQFIIKTWIKENYQFSDYVAQAIDIVTRPIDDKKGGAKKIKHKIK